MQTIAEVITRLEQITAWAKENESPLGYFAAVHLKITLAVKDGIENGAFENGSRMEQLDVRFAQRYFDAFDARQAGKPTGKSWAAAFDAAGNTQLTVLQHILLGINAHINLDLGIAAAQTRSGDAIFGLRKDFDRINDIIAELTDRVQNRLAKKWLPFGLLDFLLRTEDEGWVNFSIRAARGAAWKSAATLALTQESDAEKALIRELDNGISFFAGRITKPGWWITRGLRIMRRREGGTVREKIDTLMKI